MSQVVTMSPKELIVGFSHDEIKGMYLAVSWDKLTSENLGMKGNERMLEIITEAGALSPDETQKLDLRAKCLFDASFDPD